MHKWTDLEIYHMEYNTSGTFQTSNSNMPLCYIFRWTGNTYTLQQQYTFHEFNSPGIPEGEIVFPTMFMTLMRKFPIGINIQMKQSIIW